MSPRAKLRAVDTPAAEPLDIGLLMRAERDDPERWQRVHEDGDKRKPVFMPDVRGRRLWLR